MPYKERKVEKLYYTIGEVAEMFGVNTSLIRFWEKSFDIIKPKKTRRVIASSPKKISKIFILSTILLRSKA